jgi:hypothetical protein
MESTFHSLSPKGTDPHPNTPGTQMHLPGFARMRNSEMEGPNVSTQHLKQFFLESVGQTMSQKSQMVEISLLVSVSSVVLAEKNASQTPKDHLKKCFNSSWQRNSWVSPWG